MKKNQTLLQAFEWYLPPGGHWNLLRQRAPELAAAGFTSLWLPPAYKGHTGTEDVGYGVYDIYDLGEFDQKGSVATKYGTKDEYLATVQALHKNGISVLADVVLNHRMGGDEPERVAVSVVSDQHREQILEGNREITAWTKFNFPGRRGKYSRFQWSWQDFNGIDWDDDEKRRAIYLFQGKQWNEIVDLENDNFDYLMGANLDMNNPEVLSELRRWGRWYLKFTGVDGFRLDAVKHIRFTFFRDWLEDLRQYSGQSLPAVGEYWSGELDLLLKYLGECEHCIQLFDVPLHFAFCHASKSSGKYDMAKLRSGSLWECENESAVTFVDNHDTQPGQALQSWVLDWFKPIAYALILLQKGGTPCVFWGDWAGVPHDGIAPVSELPTLTALRQSNAYGDECAYFDHRDVVGLTRLGDEDHPGLALLLSDGIEGVKPMYVGQRYAGTAFHDALGNSPGTVVIGADGRGFFRVENSSVSVWVP